MPCVEAIFQSRILRSGSGFLGSTCDIVFSLALAGLRGTSCRKQNPFRADCRSSITESIFTKMPYSDVSFPSPSRSAALNTWAEAGERLVPARSAQRGLAGSNLPDTSHLPAHAGALFQLFPPGQSGRSDTGPRLPLPSSWILFRVSFVRGFLQGVGLGEGCWRDAAVWGREK